MLRTCMTYLGHKRKEDSAAYITTAWQKATIADRQAQTRQTAEAALHAVEAWKEFNALVRRLEVQ